MTSRERVVAALNHREADCVPIDVGGTMATTLHKLAHDRLKAFLKLEGGETEVVEFNLQSVVPDPRITALFGGDVAGLFPRAPESWTLKFEPDGTFVDEWGIRSKMSRAGWYYDMCQHPFQRASLADLEKHPWPNPRDPSRFRGLREQARDLYENSGYALVMNAAFGGGAFMDCAWLAGFDRWFPALVLEKAFARALIERVVDFHLGYWDGALDAVGKYVQVVEIADDLGTQDAPFLSPALYRELIKPAHQKITRFIKGKADVKVFLHSDGAIRPLIPDLIDAGVDILNPVQVSARGMDTAELKKEFGSRLTFWGGGCDTQSVLPRGSAAEVRAEVKRRMADLAPGGGFVFAPVHNIQPDVSPENIVALYRAAAEHRPYGR